MSFYDPKLASQNMMDPQQQYNFNYQTYMAPQNMRVPLNQSSLTQEEIAKLKTSRPTSAFNIQISEDEYMRAMCNHFENGVSKVVRLNDGTDRCYCPICQSVWSPQQYSKEEIREVCDNLISAMQSTKYAGELTPAVIREYFSMIPLIDKFPELYDYALKNCNTLMNQMGYNVGQDASIYAQYNSMFTPNMYGIYNNPPQPYYGMPQQGYYNAPQQPQNPNMMMGQQQNMYYNPQQQNPMVNPMQVQPQQQPQGYYQPSVNPQFTSQANMMMAQNNPQQPFMGQPQVIQPAQQVIAPQQPYVPTYAAPQSPQQPVVEQKNTKIDL